MQEHTDKKHRAPTLTAIIVGDDPSSKIYVKNKVKTAHFVGEQIVNDYFERRKKNLLLRYY